VHVLSGADNFQTFLLHTPTPMSTLGADSAWEVALGDYNRDGIADLYLIGKERTGTVKTEVHVLSGADNFQTLLLHTATPLSTLGADSAWEALIDPTGTVYFYTPSPINNISGRAYANEGLGEPPMPHAPYRHMYWSVWGQTNEAVSQPIRGWNLGDFTGAYVLGPLEDHQRGYNPASYGGSAVSMHDSIENGIKYPVFGAMINSWNYPQGIDKYNLMAANLAYKFDPTDNLRPFSYGATSKLNFSLMLQVPTAYAVGGARAHLGPSITLEDTSDPNTPKYFWIAINAFDTGKTATHTENVDWDVGTAAAVVGSFFGPGTRYSSTASSSHISTSTPWIGWRWYSFSIGIPQLKNIIADLNAKCTKWREDNTRSDCSYFSTNPSDYKLGMLLLDAEIARPNGQGNANMGFSTYGIWLFTEY
jgi:hypothetical protein